MMALFLALFYPPFSFLFSFFDSVQMWPFLRCAWFHHNYLLYKLCLLKWFLNQFWRKFQAIFKFFLGWYAYYIIPNKDFYHRINFNWGKNLMIPFEKHSKFLSWKIYIYESEEFSIINSVCLSHTISNYQCPVVLVTSIPLTTFCWSCYCFSWSILKEVPDIILFYPLIVQ